MQIDQYDTVLLKDGRTACIVEVLAPDVFIADMGDSPKNWETINLTTEEIEKVIKKN